MKSGIAALLVALSFPLASQASDAEANPIQKIISLLTSLQGKVIAEGEAKQRLYEEYVQWCQKTSTAKQYEIKDGISKKETLEATIAKATSDEATANTRIQELSGSIATDEADVKAAGMLREKQHKDFQEVDEELIDTIETLGRAQRVVEKEMQKSPSFLQKPSVGLQKFTDSIQLLITSAALISSEDRATLTSMIQQQDASDDTEADQEDDEEDAAMNALGAPSSQSYQSHSGGILDTLQEMEEKAETAQAETRKKESNLQHTYEMFKQSLQDTIKAESEELAETKQNLAAFQEQRATAEGDLDICKKDLEKDKEMLRQLQHDCMNHATEFEADVKDRKEELQALASAKKVIQDTTGGASSQSYSFLQVSSGSQSVDGQALGASDTAELARRRAGAAALQHLRGLATTVRSSALAQLASVLFMAMRGGVGNRADPFKKVKNLISDMVARLEQEAQEEAEQKEFCDREMARTEASKADKEGDIEGLTTKLEKAAAEIAQLKEEITELSQGIAELEQSQADQTKLRQEEHALFLTTKQDLQDGLTGVRMALKILRDYYSQGDQDASFAQTSVESSMLAASGDAAPSTGASSGIIGILEVVESDFSKNFAEVQEDEDTSQADFERIIQQTKVTKAEKETAQKYKMQQATSLEKLTSELESDRAGVQDELDAVNEYYEKLKPQCIAKPDSYEERKQRRDKEIAGLKEALSILMAEDDA